MIEFQNPKDAAHWLKGKVSRELWTDSRQVRAGDGFIAWPGGNADGRQFVRSCLEQGAGACLVEKQGFETFGIASSNSQVASYANLKPATGLIAAEYYGHPSQSIDVIAVTGTNGKTSTVWWLAQALTHVESVAAKKCGLVGTLGVGQAKSLDESNEAVVPLLANGLTTPDPVLLQQTFRRFVNAGFTACAIEASSIGIEEHRLAGTVINVAVFTNFTHDHLDYHSSMDAYWLAKEKLFNWPTLKAAVINVDDPKGKELVASLARRSVDVWTTSTRSVARIQAQDICYSATGLKFSLVEGSERHSLQTALIGEYNIANMLGVIATLRLCGVDLINAVEICQRLTAVPGRMECISHKNQPAVVIDYAHTPDALKNALGALRLMANERQGQLICVFGCGGNRDALKRPLMAATAEHDADKVIVTADNSRQEPEDEIFADIMAGFTNRAVAKLVRDRSLAISQAVLEARPNDVILVAGKGHEDYQDEKGQKKYFSDKEQALAALMRRSKS